MLFSDGPIHFGRGPTHNVIRSPDQPVKVLYISYFGALKPLCQTQVIPYLEELAKDGLEIILLSFEERLQNREEERQKREDLRCSLLRSQIEWHPLRYHKRPSLPATIYDVVVGTIVAARIVRSNGIEVIHARNHVPALIALVLKKMFKIKLVFDMRGVMAEEYVDAGTWKRGSIPFRLTKWVESETLRRADAIIMLTHKIRERLQASSLELYANPAPIEVIPCCVDLRRYASRPDGSLRSRLGLDGKWVMVYSGSLGGWYLASEMVALFSEMSKLVQNSHFLVLTQSYHELIAMHFRRQRIPLDRYTIITASPQQVPSLLSSCDFGVSFIKPCYSKLSSSPTKIGEYLAAGLPFITNPGIGDVDELITGEGVGVFAQSFEPAAYHHAVLEMLRLLENREQIRSRCRHSAESHLSLSGVGREGYRRVYLKLGWIGSASGRSL
jgi:glycosyltransferase involved in cell wall biosynthesis